MGLADQVTARIPPVTLVQLTRNLPGATTVDTTLLAYAVADVVGDLATYAGVTYDDADARQVAVAVRGVVLTLLSYRGEASYIQSLRDWREQDLKKGLRSVTAGNRLLPVLGGTVLTPTQAAAGEVIRPLTDPTWLSEILPGAGPNGDWQGPQG